MQWTAPSPLWAQASIAAEPAPRRALLRRPTILRFASDDFMEDFLKVLEHDPARLPDYVARPETWRGPAAEAPPVKPAPAFARALSRLGLIASRQKSAAALIGSSGPVSSSLQALVGGNANGDAVKSLPLKLYQPALTLLPRRVLPGVRRPGLPDHPSTHGWSSALLVILRYCRAVAWTPSPLPALDDTWGVCFSPWIRIRVAGFRMKSRTRRLFARKREQCRSSVCFHRDLAVVRLLAGVVPVGKREALMGAGQLRQDGDPEPIHAPPQPVDPRTALMRSQVRDPWKNLIERADAAKAAQGPPLPSPPAPPSNDEPMPDDAKAVSLKVTREETQTLSWYILLDFAGFLERQLPRVWQALRGQTPSPALNINESALVAAIGNVAVDQTSAPNLKTALANGVYTQADVMSNLREALLAIKGLAPASNKSAQQIEDDLDRVTKSYDRDAPEATWPDFLFPLADPEFSLTTRVGVVQVPLNQERVNLFARLIEAALPQQAAAPAPKLPLAAQPVMDMREGWFVIRCVFERPRCGSIDPPLVSERTGAVSNYELFDRTLRQAAPHRAAD